MNDMTVSISKGHSNESSARHNNRKTNLEHASEDKKKAFYEQKGHRHIHEEYTYLNEDFIEDPHKIYDEEFEDAIQEYNNKQSRKNRMIGKGKALTVAEKEFEIKLYEEVLKVRRMKKSDRKEYLGSLDKKSDFTNDLNSFLDLNNNKSIRDLHKELTKIKHTETLGEAYYNKVKHSKQGQTHVEFIVQLGSAKDFNEIDENGRIVKSYDRTNPHGIWQRSKRVLQQYEKVFEKNNPNMIVCEYSVHMDESTPHLHLQAIPIALTSETTARGTDRVDNKTKKVIKARRNGLSRKVSFDGALECEGFKRDLSDSRKNFTDWQNKQADDLVKVMKSEFGINRKKGITNRFKDVHEYKLVKEQQAQQNEKLHQLEANVKAQTATYSSNERKLNAQNILLNQSSNRLDTLFNYNELVATNYKAQAEQAKKEQKEAEEARDNAKQQQKEAEKAKLKADKQAKLANQHLIDRLNAHERELSARSRDLNIRELGGVDKYGNHVEGIFQRENALDKRELQLNEREQKLDTREAKITERETKLKTFVNRIKNNFKYNYFKYAIENCNLKLNSNPLKLAFKVSKLDKSRQKNIEHKLFNNGASRLKTVAYALTCTFRDSDAFNEITDLAKEVNRDQSTANQQLTNTKAQDKSEEEKRLSDENHENAEKQRKLAAKRREELLNELDNTKTNTKQNQHENYIDFDDFD